MGLQEKRAMKAAQEWLPGREKELSEISGGGKILYEVDWPSFEADAKGIEWLEHNGPQQVSAALRGICHDDLGREAIREGLEKVALRNVATVAERRVTFAGGVLELRCAFALSPGGRFTDGEIRRCLEAGL